MRATTSRFGLTLVSFVAMAIASVGIVFASSDGSGAGGAPGDADCGGQVNAIDAAIVLQYIADLIPSVPCQQGANVDDNGIVDSIDVALVLQYVAGLLPSLGPHATPTPTQGPAGPALTVDKFGEGIVSSSPGGINCGPACTVQSATFVNDREVILTASPQLGSAFDHWSGCDFAAGSTCRLTLAEDRTVFATFRLLETAIPSTTKVLDEAAMGHLLRQEGDTYYFDTQAAAAADLRAGDVMVSSVGEGLLRKVTSVDAAAGEIAVSTEVGTLEDVIEKGTILIHQELVPAPGAAGIADQLNVGFADGLGLSGSYSFRPYLDVAISFDGFEFSCLCYPVREARTVLHMDQTSALTLLAEGGISFSGERNVWQQPLTPILVPVGPIVLVFVPELSVDVGVSVNARVGFETQVSLSKEFSAGVEYARDAGWRGIGDLSRTSSFEPPHVSDAVEAKAYLSPEFSLRLAGVAGPYVSVEGFGRLRAEPNDDPWWSLSAGVGASAGFAAEVPVFGQIAEFHAVVLEAEWLLAQASSPAPTPPTNTPVPTPAASAVSAGLYHTCAVTGSGGVKCWGRNNFGQLGDGTTTDRSTPVDVHGLTGGIAAVSAGSDHTCALTTAGGVKCWGLNSNGKLGEGTNTGPELCEVPSFGFLACSTTPVDVSGLSSGVSAVSVGNSQACVLTIGGGVKCWGGVNPKTPTDISGLTSGVVAVSAGGQHACALTSAGGVECWGWNGLGQLGDGTTTDRSAPVDVHGLTGGVAAISAGGGVTCALTSAGGVKCGGLNEVGMLGNGMPGPEVCLRAWACSTLPLAVSDLTSGITGLSAGTGHTCALTKAGGVKCWGGNANGQLGNGTETNKATPVDVSGLVGGVVAVSSGGGHTCAVTIAAGVKCWGSNDVGQLGNGTNAGPAICEFSGSACSTVPIDVIGLPSGKARL